MTDRVQTMPLGVVVEWREIDNPWQQGVWTPVAVIPGAGATDEWKLLAQEANWRRFHAATLPLALHRKETEAYRTNLSNAVPVVYVVLRSIEDAASPREVEPFLVTASPYEAQDYLDSGEDVVEGVPMPEGVVAWVQDFIDRHHVDEPFHKRKRKRYDPDEVAFGRSPDDRGRGRKG